jgi:Fe-S-cluster containining protein
VVGLCGQVVSHTVAMPHPVTAPITAAYAEFERRASAWSATFRAHGGHIHCGPGCYHCCDFPIRASLAEALLAQASLSRDQQQALASRAHASIANAQASRDWDDYFGHHRQHIGHCPLLDATGRCSAYAVRPGRCRDTASALPARYCQVGVLEQLSKSELRQYKREVRANPATDGENHYIAPLEDLGQLVWDAASRAMQQAWGLEVWGDFCLLVTLAGDAGFIGHVERGERRAAMARAKALGLWHRELLEVE